MLQLSTTRYSQTPKGVGLKSARVLVCGDPFLQDLLPPSCLQLSPGQRQHFSSFIPHLLEVTGGEFSQVTGILNQLPFPKSPGQKSKLPHVSPENPTSGNGNAPLTSPARAGSAATAEHAAAGAPAVPAAAWEAGGGSGCSAAGMTASQALGPAPQTGAPLLPRPAVRRGASRRWGKALHSAPGRGTPPGARLRQSARAAGRRERGVFLSLGAQTPGLGGTGEGGEPSACP